MLGKMRYRLGLDLGTSSIGWCLIRLDANEAPVAIIKMGSRIFSDGRNPKDGSSLAVTRREARQQRRRRDRLLKRKQRMLNDLVNLGFFPKDEQARHSLTSLDPYSLRKKGLYEPLTGGEFARALFHIGQRRGFLSNRKTDKNDNESGALKKAIKDLREKLDQESCQTLGEWLANRHERGESVRARLHGKTKKDKFYDFYVDRAMIEHEFDALWAKQAAFNPGLFTEAARHRLKDTLLFQRKLKPVKPGRCTLLPNEERAPLALPSVQQFRNYQEVNNLRVLNEDLTENPPLTLDQRDKVVALLESGKNATFKTAIRKELSLPTGSRFNLEDDKRDRLKGNATSAILSKEHHFGQRWHNFDLAMQDEIVDRLLNEAIATDLMKWLQEYTSIDEATAERLVDVSLPEGYGRLSRKAIAKILPELAKDVLVYSDAVVRAGFDSHSALSYTEQTGEIMESLPYYGIPLQRHVAFAKDNPVNDEERYGKIANPTVHIGLNELRKVINAIIKRYGHPSEIIVEVARELKLSQKRKQEIEKDQASRQKLNTEHVTEACAVLGLEHEHIDRSKRRELSQKMQLWVELNPNIADRRCPYTGEQISIGRLLSNDVEIEHILPYSKTLDDSLNNKTVAMRNANRDKGNQTPHEAFSGHPLYDYTAILERAARMPRAKARRFAPDAYQNWLKNDKDFLARALTDTAYLSRIAKEYLTLICPPNKVRVIPGRMTSLLRGKYGLNELLSGTSLKNRNDHRHHALDAAVIGITDQGLLQRFANASASAHKKHINKLVETMPLPWPTYRDHVTRALGEIIVSHKPDHGYQGAFLKASAWGLREDGKVEQYKKNEDGTRQRLTKNLKVIPISSTRNLKRHGTDKEGQPAAYKGYVGGSNYCIEIWRNDKGRWQGNVISTYEAYQIIRRHGEADGLKKLRNKNFTQTGKSLVMRLINNDMVKMDVNGKRQVMRVVKLRSNGQMFFSPHHEANVDSRHKDKGDPFTYITKFATTLQKAKGLHVTVSEIGVARGSGLSNPVK